MPKSRVSRTSPRPSRRQDRTPIVRHKKKR
jgi:hypothetical protein